MAQARVNANQLAREAGEHFNGILNATNTAERQREAGSFAKAFNEYVRLLTKANAAERPQLAEDFRRAMGVRGTAIYEAYKQKPGRGPYTKGENVAGAVLEVLEARATGGSMDPLRRKYSKDFLDALSSGTIAAIPIPAFNPNALATQFAKGTDLTGMLRAVATANTTQRETLFDQVYAQMRKDDEGFTSKGGDNYPKVPKETDVDHLQRYLAEINPAYKPTGNTDDAFFRELATYQDKARTEKDKKRTSEGTAIAGFDAAAYRKEIGFQRPTEDPAPSALRSADKDLYEAYIKDWLQVKIGERRDGEYELYDFVGLVRRVSQGVREQGLVEEADTPVEEAANRRKVKEWMETELKANHLREFMDKKRPFVAKAMAEEFVQANGVKANVEKLLGGPTGAIGPQTNTEDRRDWEKVRATEMVLQLLAADERFEDIADRLRTVRMDSQYGEEETTAVKALQDKLYREGASGTFKDALAAAGKLREQIRQTGAMDAPTLKALGLYLADAEGRAITEARAFQVVPRKLERKAMSATELQRAVEALGPADRAIYNNGLGEWLQGGVDRRRQTREGKLEDYELYNLTGLIAHAKANPGYSFDSLDAELRQGSLSEFMGHKPQIRVKVMERGEERVEAWAPQDLLTRLANGADVRKVTDALFESKQPIDGNLDVADPLNAKKVEAVGMLLNQLATERGFDKVAGLKVPRDNSYENKQAAVAALQKFLVAEANLKGNEAYFEALEQVGLRSGTRIDIETNGAFTRNTAMALGIYRAVQNGTWKAEKKKAGPDFSDIPL